MIEKDTLRAPSKGLGLTQNLSCPLSSGYYTVNLESLRNLMKVINITDFVGSDICQEGYFLPKVHSEADNRNLDLFFQEIFNFFNFKGARERHALS